MYSIKRFSIVESREFGKKNKRNYPDGVVGGKSYREIDKMSVNEKRDFINKLTDDEIESANKEGRNNTLAGLGIGTGLGATIGAIAGRGNKDAIGAGAVIGAQMGTIGGAIRGINKAQNRFKVAKKNAEDLDDYEVSRGRQARYVNEKLKY